MADGDVVVVTGAAGCLGQHLIHLLQVKTSVKEIRAFDVRGYSNKMDHTERIPVTNIVGDLRKLSDLKEAFLGADVVFHMASLIDVAAFPDYKKMEEINVNGTSNVIAACLQQSVQRLIYTSTVDVVIDNSWDDMIDVTEVVPYAERHIFRGYAGSKCRAEQLVLAANGKQMRTGFLRTLSLRPVTFYGENSAVGVTNTLEEAKARGGTLYMPGGEGLQSLAYAGNIAWAHIVGSRVLKDNPKVGGEAFFTTDDTPDVPFSQFLKPFLECRGFRLSNFRVPFWGLYFAVCLVQLACLLVQPVWKVTGPKIATRCSFRYLHRNLTFSGEKAHKMLDYKPQFTFKESMERCLNYYTNPALQFKQYIGPGESFCF